MIIQSRVNILAAISSIIQSTPFNRFSPVTALHLAICQWWVLIWSSSSISLSCSGEQAPGKSCLLAKINRVAPANLCQKYLKNKSNPHNYRAPPPVTACAVHPYNPPGASYLHYPPPKSDHLYTRNSSSNMNATTFAPPHPTSSAWNWNIPPRYLTRRFLDTYPLCSRVLMLKPRVGEIVSMGSPLNRFKIVVLPALSKPL